MANLINYRTGIGIIILNNKEELLIAQRADGSGSWQFPQGGLHTGETFEAAMYRELYEEVGLSADKVMLLAHTHDWLIYRFPEYIIRARGDDLDSAYIGQKQRWFLLKLLGTMDDIKFDVTDKPEFSAARWVDYWRPLQEVVDFKYQVYRQALEYFAAWVRP